MKYYFLKLDNGFFTNKYIRALKRLSQGDSIIYIFLKLQLKFPDGIFHYERLFSNNISELAITIDEDEPLVKLAVETLTRFGMIESKENGDLKIMIMEGIVGCESTSAKRMRKHRQHTETAVQECEKEPRPETPNDEEKPPLQTVPEEPVVETDPLQIVRASCPLTKIKDSFNSICISYPTIRAISGSREIAVKARWRTNPDIETFITLFKKSEASDFLKGKNSRSWSANFDWMMNPVNFDKILEGKYDNKNSTATQENTTFYTL